MTSKPDSWQEDSCFRMRQLQVFNWGTFDGLHSMPIAWKGYLFLGASGSGKSTLLDAIASLLVPPRAVQFNAAARDTEKNKRDRSLLSYVRGAYSEQTVEETGEIATQYLRPDSTWSALSLTYANGRGQVVSLLQLYIIKGTSSQTEDIRKHFFVLDRHLDLKDLDGFDGDVRKLRQKLVDAHYFPDFRSYSEKFCWALGIDNESTLTLLHKTQSAKHLGDLNLFLREFMLERPETYTVCETLINEFRDLNEAHQRVVTARKQVDLLRPAQVAFVERTAVEEERSRLSDLRSAIDPYRDILKASLLTVRIGELASELDLLRSIAHQTDEEYETANSQLHSLQQRHWELGGHHIEQLEQKLSELAKTNQQRIEKRVRMTSSCEKLAWSVPTSPEAFSALATKARNVLDARYDESERIRKEQLTLSTNISTLERERTTCSHEVAALKRQPSNIDAHMLDIRKEMSAALNIPEHCLPFAGELIQVRKEHAAWQGAIERLLKGFAVSLLVEEKYYNAVNAYVNATHLGGRLSFYVTGAQVKNTNRNVPLRQNTVCDKLEIKECSHSAWLNAELRQRFNYQCVGSSKVLQGTPYSITIEGLIRHNERHDKDDLYKVSDRRHWRLGFDNREKLQIYLNEESRLSAEIASIETKLRELQAIESRQADDALECQLFTNLQWSEVDVESIRLRIEMLEKELQAARQSDSNLEKLGAEIETQRKTVDAIYRKRTQAGVKHDSVERDLNKLKVQLASVPQSELATEIQNDLQARLLKITDEITWDSFERNCSKLQNAINDDMVLAANKSSVLRQTIELAFTEFHREWSADAGDLVDTSIESAPEFFAMLVRLETDRLPEFEAKFFELLRDQSNQNLASLSTHLNEARKAIHERMEFVNESLSNAPFDDGTYLYIKTTDRQIPEVQAFKQELRAALQYAFNDDKAQSEIRFEILRGLVERLASEEPHQKRWKEQVLDVRQHVEFLARELNADGKEVEIYRTGAGKSGGQKQKLATTCLAAALNYQLRNDDGQPAYAAVVLDEAFDKADQDFTALAMNIFNRFGFQMIVATPMKSIRTLERFVGGACFVHIRDRSKSSVLLIEYDEEKQRLALPDTDPILNVTLLPSEEMGEIPSEFAELGLRS